MSQHRIFLNINFHICNLYSKYSHEYFIIERKIVQPVEFIYIGVRVMKESLSIKIYDRSNYAEFRKDKYKFPKEFDILPAQTFNNNKNIYILQENRIFFKPKTLGYAIICNFKNFLTYEKSQLAACYKVNVDVFLNHDGYYIEDFMIGKLHRRKGYATYFFNELKKKFYNDVDLLLCADGDGLKFWHKVGFSRVDDETPTMILRK